jgi:hypothetical protein
MTIEWIFPAGVRAGATRAIAWTAVAVLTACGEGRSPARNVRLEATGDTVLTPYVEITDAAWLAETRWVVIAPQDRGVSVADFGRKALSRFGGRQAAELDQPFHLFRSADSIYVADWMRRRLTAWSLEGRYGGGRPAEDALRGALPRDRDDSGRWYYELRPPAGRDGRGNLDSAVIVRASGEPVVFDTIGRLAPLELAEVVSDGQRRLERRLLSGQDRWGVLPDGSLWVARVNGSRVDWRDPGGRTVRGEALPDRVLPVTQNDRDIFLQRFESALRASVSQIPFAAIKPPFDAALTGPGGQVWLVRSRAVGDTLREYTIVDRRGRLAGALDHPGLGRILAVGGGYALVGEPFADGVRLLLFRVPVSAGTGTS